MSDVLYKYLHMLISVLCKRFINRPAELLAVPLGPRRLLNLSSLDIFILTTYIKRGGQLELFIKVNLVFCESTIT